MKLEILRDIHALEEDIRAYERKYGVLTETFYESYSSAKSHQMTPGHWIGMIGQPYTKFGCAAVSNIDKRLLK